MQKELGLVDAAPALPDGVAYQPDIVSPEQEPALLERVRELPLKEFEFHGYTRKRRVMSYGWKYDFTKRAEFAGIAAEQLQQVLVTEYDVGAAIGWHRDKAVFGDVIGISLLSSARFRLRRKVGTSWERASLTVEPRSAYLLRGPSRTEWEHSIPAVDALLYSITLRNFREGAGG